MVSSMFSLCSRRYPVSAETNPLLSVKMTRLCVLLSLEVAQRGAHLRNGCLITIEPDMHCSTASRSIPPFVIPSACMSRVSVQIRTLKICLSIFSRRYCKCPKRDFSDGILMLVAVAAANTLIASKANSMCTVDLSVPSVSARALSAVRGPCSNSCAICRRIMA